MGSLIVPILPSFVAFGGDCVLIRFSSRSHLLFVSLTWVMLGFGHEVELKAFSGFERGSLSLAAYVRALVCGPDTRSF